MIDLFLARERFVVNLAVVALLLIPGHSSSAVGG